MERTLRNLLALSLLVGVLGGVEYFTSVDVPGFELKETGLSISAVDYTEDQLFSEGSEARTSERDTSPARVEISDAHLGIVTWNLYNFGRTKDAQEIRVAADLLRWYDLVAIQEVVTSPPGAQAVARLDAALDRRGYAWDYRISNPTTGAGTERYAFLWKPSRVRLLGDAWLASSLSDRIDREPYLARFQHKQTGDTVLVASLHAVPRSKSPEREVALLDELHRQYANEDIVLLGDFNLDEDDEAFDDLRTAGYRAVLDDQKTSLGRTRSPEPEGHLASEYDNIFVETGPLHAVRGRAIDFTSQFPSLGEARSLSDHLPVFVSVEWTGGQQPLTP